MTAIPSTEKIERIEELVTEKIEKLREGAGSLGAKAKDFARENPIKSTALAAGLGIATGLAVRQARS